MTAMMYFMMLVPAHLPLHIVGALAVNPRVEALLLGLGADAQTDEGLDRLGDGEAYHERPEQGCDDAGELDARLSAHAPAFRITDAAKRRVHQDGGEEDASRTPDTVHGEYVEGIVDSEAPLHHAHHKIADRSAGEADDERSHGTDT